MAGGRRRRARIAALLLAGSCASAPADDALLRHAREARAAGDLERALRYTERALQRPPYDARQQEVALHLEILRALERHVEADALQAFSERLAAGEDTDADATEPSRDDCQRMERLRSGVRSLVRRFGEPRVHSSLEFGFIQATYQISADARPVNIRVVRAKHPAAAWLMISSLAEAKVWRARVDALPPEAFPVPHCALWEHRLTGGRMPLL